MDDATESWSGGDCFSVDIVRVVVVVVGERNDWTKVVVVGLEEKNSTADKTTFVADNNGLIVCWFV